MSSLEVPRTWNTPRPASIDKPASYRTNGSRNKNTYTRRTNVYLSTSECQSCMGTPAFSDLARVVCSQIVSYASFIPPGPMHLTANNATSHTYSESVESSQVQYTGTFQNVPSIASASDICSFLLVATNTDKITRVVVPLSEATLMTADPNLFLTSLKSCHPRLCKT